MAEGLNAVIGTIEAAGAVRINERYDFDRHETVVDFERDGLPYQVRVSDEFDEDYASGRSSLDLDTLWPLVRESSSGHALVTNDRIICH
ncbi:MAG TPA: hypothetical protein VFU86_07280 [Terriglobales bacterium]|nr:hypothetical protein [Terriglobales bacterium]